MGQKPPMLHQNKKHLHLFKFILHYGERGRRKSSSTAGLHYSVHLHVQATSIVLNGPFQTMCAKKIWQVAFCHSQTILLKSINNFIAYISAQTKYLVKQHLNLHVDPLSFYIKDTVTLFNNTSLDLLCFPLGKNNLLLAGKCPKSVLQGGDVENLTTSPRFKNSEDRAKTQSCHPQVCKMTKCLLYAKSAWPTFSSKCC